MNTPRFSGFCLLFLCSCYGGLLLQGRTVEANDLSRRGLAMEAAPAPGISAQAPAGQPSKTQSSSNSSALPLDKIALPPGFQISLFTTKAFGANPRSLALNSPGAGKKSIVYVGTDAPAPNGTVRDVAGRIGRLVSVQRCDDRMQSFSSGSCRLS